MDMRARAVRALHEGNPEPAVQYNRTVQLLHKNKPNCGGCIGAGTGGRCCICGKPRTP